jgi:uncharacterized membrane protein YoaK (UPF0700 family)
VGWTRRTSILLASVAVALTAHALVLIAWPDPGRLVELVVTGGTALAMGAQAGAARHIAVKDVTTVVVTSTLVGLAFDSRLGGADARHPWARRVGAVMLIGAGAAAGALLLRLGIGQGIALSAVITVAVTVVGHVCRPTAKDAGERATG